MEVLTEEQEAVAAKLFLDAIGWSWVEDHNRYFGKGIQAVALFIDSLHKHSLDERILKELRGNNLYLHRIIHLLFNRILGGVMSQVGDPMLPIAPGNSPQYAVAPTPADVVTVAAQTAWSIVTSDPGITIAANASDATGLTATVTIPAGAVEPFNFTATWTYTNADGTTATASLAQADTTTPVVNVTGGTVSQII